MEPSSASGVPIVIYTQPIKPKAVAHPTAEARKDLLRQMTVLGSLQIAFGILCIIFEVVGMAFALTSHLYGFFHGGSGIWIGVFFVITGAFGCAARKQNRRGFMITFNALSIIAAFATILRIVVAAVILVFLKFIEPEFYRTGRYGGYLPERLRALRVSLATESLMIIILVAEAIVAIWSSVVCCKIGVCCCDCGGDCCCPPAPPPTQVLWTQQIIGGVQQQQQQQQPQPILVYTEPPSQSAANVLPGTVPHQPNILSA